MNSATFSVEPAAIALEPTSMSPNPSVILPESRAPTVTIFEVPVVAPNTASASALVYLLDNSVATFVAPKKNLLSLTAIHSLTVLMKILQQEKIV